LKKQACKTAEDSAKALKADIANKDGVIDCYESENKRLREFIAAMHRQSGCIVSEEDDFEDAETVLF
jgi:hypothetical protein